MLFRELVLVEKSLTAAELIKHGGKYLSALIGFIKAGQPMPVDPAYRQQYGDTVHIDQKMLPRLEQALKSPDIKAALPPKVDIIVNGQKESESAPWGVLFKGKEFTNFEGKKAYNAGHLAELFMGLSVSAKFFNLGNPVTVANMMDMMDHIDERVDGKNYVFSIQRLISYPEKAAKKDMLTFLARVPARSAEAFLEQSRAKKFEPDLAALLASAVRYINEAPTVDQSCKIVRADKNSNKIEVVSDGTTDAKMTKADLTLKVDGTKVNLLSLKTYSSDTLGQISGVEFDSIRRWFNLSFGINVDQHKELFASDKSQDERLKSLLYIYDTEIYPAVEQQIEGQKPGTEAAIVKNIANAALYHARGEGMEDVEVVKLDDKISSGSYKVLRFSDNLVDAMGKLDLQAKLISGGQGRTIQIWVKPTEGLIKKATKLCQFRTQKMGGYVRNFFESGPMLEELTSLDAQSK